LIETLRQAQRFGFFGDRPIEQAIEHARQFVLALDAIDRPCRLLDLGSGGGLPGLVIAAHFPTSAITLLDRRQKRTDFLERAVTRLDYRHVTVLCRDADDMVGSIAIGDAEPFDVVTARGFGPPEMTLRTGVACCGDGGVVVISEPPSGDRWTAQLLDELGVTSEAAGSVRRFTTVHSRKTPDQGTHGDN
jgi:16S rRNA (guanine527-N7)-methyltransferase